MGKATNFNFKAFKVDNSDWITNFWYVNNKLFLTQSLFNEDQNFLGYLTLESLNNNLGFKKTSTLDFINYPDPTFNSALEASTSEVKAIIYFQDYIYNLVYLDDHYYLAIIDYQKTSGKTFVYNDKFEKVSVIDDYLILGKLQDTLVFTNFFDRQTYFYQNQSFQPTKINHLTKIINFDDFDLIITQKEIYQVKAQKNTLLFESMDEIKVAKLNDQVIVISSKALMQTFAFSLINYQKNFITNDYFFNLAVINNKILVGKPLYLNGMYEDYSLPLTFIL